jgi:hypothetical protein
MSSVTLVHPEETLKVPVLQVITKCSLFQKNQTLSAAPYRIKSSVTLPHFREFVSGLEGKEVEITDTNFPGLQRLCEEFGFSDFAAKLSEFRPAMGFQEAADAGARGRIAALEEKAKRHNRDIAVLQDKFARLSTDFVRLAMEVSALQSAATPPAPTPPPQPIPPSPQQAVLSAPPLDSHIISDIPEIVAGFKKKRFALLWRGSRDGFGGKNFSADSTAAQTL